jgi:hypothetical protein
MRLAIEINRSLPRCWRAYYKSLVEAGIYVGGDPVEVPETGVTVRVKEGKRRVQRWPLRRYQGATGGIHNPGTWRARNGRTEWIAIMLFYEQLVRISPTLGTRTGYAAAVGEANGPEAGLALLDGIDPGGVCSYQPYSACSTRTRTEISFTHTPLMHAAPSRL